jgi:hypothetical protein
MMSVIRCIWSVVEWLFLNPNWCVGTNLIIGLRRLSINFSNNLDIIAKPHFLKEFIGCFSWSPVTRGRRERGRRRRRRSRRRRKRRRRRRIRRRIDQAHTFINSRWNFSSEIGLVSDILYHNYNMPCVGLCAFPVSFPFAIVDEDILPFWSRINIGTVN